MGKRPDYIVRAARETGEKKWIDIGIAYANKRSITVYLSALPLNGKIVLIPVNR